MTTPIPVSSEIVDFDSDISRDPYSKEIAIIVEKTLMEYPEILESVLQKNIHILESIFEQNPHILWNAQQRMIQEFSSQVAEDVYQHTLTTLEHTPDLWHQMHGNPLTKGPKIIVAFLDPLCPHSALLLKNMMILAKTSKDQIGLCPHWVTKHSDKKSQIIARALLAAHKLDALESFLESLIDCIQEAKTANVLDLAAQLGFNMQEFQAHMFSETTEKSIADARTHFNQFQFQGFPIILYKKEKMNVSQDQKKLFELIEGNPNSLQDLAALLSH